MEKNSSFKHNSLSSIGSLKHKSNSSCISITEIGEKKEYKFFKLTEKTKKLEKLFNNKLLSDVKIKFENSDTVVYCHKNILSISSDYFMNNFSNSEMLESKTNEILIEKEQDERVFVEFLKFLYTGTFNFEKEEDICLFLNLCKKVN
jgi:hypothetical protein